MTTEEREWWEKIIRQEEERVNLWDSLNEEDHVEARNSIDLLEFKHTMPDPDPLDQDNEEYNERNVNLLRLIEKKENHQPVSCPHTCLSIMVKCSLLIMLDTSKC